MARILIVIALLFSASIASTSFGNSPSGATPTEVLPPKLTTPFVATKSTFEATKALPGELIDQLMLKEVRVPNNEENQPVFKISEQSIAKSQKDSSITIWVRMLTSLAVVLVVMALAYFALRRWPVANKLGARRMIEVLSQHHIGAKKSLAVVRVAGEAVLIGITDQNITILKSLSLLDEDVALPPPLGVKTVTAVVPPPPPPQNKFQNSLAKEIKKDMDEFSMEGLREIVGDRLRSLKEL